MEGRLSLPAVVDRLEAAILADLAGCAHRGRRQVTQCHLVSLRPVLHIVAAISRRDEEVALVRQAAAGEQPWWSVPGGRVEDGELRDESLAREVLEETGLALIGPPRLAFVIQVDDRANREHATGWTFEAQWSGELRPNDPDGYVVEAAFVPLAEAVRRLEQIAWQWPTVGYLRGEVEPGSILLERRKTDGSVKRSLEPAR